MLTARIRTSVSGVCVVAALVLLVSVMPRIRAAQDDLAERSWLMRHAPAREYRVLELGEQRADLSATAVWVAVPGHSQAFIDLRGSKERVREPGQTVEARLDSRLDPGTGDGFAADNTARSAWGAYLGAGWPALLGLVVIGACLALRRPRPGR